MPDIDVAFESTAQEILEAVKGTALESTVQAILANSNTAAKESTSQSILSKLNSGMSAVKSVQRGIINIAQSETTATATISTVDTSKAVVVFSGSIMSTAYTGTASQHSRYFEAILTLSNSNTVTATRGLGESNIAVDVPYQVIEFA